MICIMHQAHPYGHLVVNERAIDAPTLARMVGGRVAEVGRWLGELERAGVYDMENGTRVSRRMVRDEALRKVRAEGGKLGGNPALMDNHKVEDKVNHDANLQPTPSSSTSSSSSKDQKHVGSAPNGARHALDSEIVITLPLREGGEFPVTQSLVAEVEPLCPAVDVPATLKEMKLWLVGNPERRKTRKGIKRFITSWLKTEQEKHGS